MWTTADASIKEQYEKMEHDNETKRDAVKKAWENARENFADMPNVELWTDKFLTRPQLEALCVKLNMDLEFKKETVFQFRNASRDKQSSYLVKRLNKYSQHVSRIKILTLNHIF